jgi:hypothetical protein
MRALRSVAASTMIADLKSERKVRCHKWAVENLPAQIATCIRTRLFKNGDRPVSPADLSSRILKRSSLSSGRMWSSAGELVMAEMKIRPVA